MYTTICTIQLVKLLRDDILLNKQDLSLLSCPVSTSVLLGCLVFSAAYYSILKNGMFKKNIQQTSF